MSALTFVSNSFGWKLGRGGRRRKWTPARKSPRSRFVIEALETRSLLSANVLQTNLVSDLPGVAQVQDPNLVNPWGISESSTSPFWISDNNAGVSTLYQVPGANNTPVSINPLVVSIPTPGAPFGATGTPTGTVFNIDGGATGGFKVSGVDTKGNPISASAVFLFDTEDGTLIGWNPTVNPKGFDPAKAGTYAIIAVDNSGNNFTQPNPAKQTGAVYKGLTTASSATPGTPIFASDPNTTTVLYAANFRSGKVEVYDTNFKSVKLKGGAFADPNLPKGFAPFNVQVLGGKVYVTYAKQDASKHDDVGGQGNGFIDVFNLNGTPGLPGGKQRLVSRGPLDSPWGLALAPSSFGAISGDLLVGNFKSGFIDVFNPTTGKSLGTLNDPNGNPIHIDGLWTLKVGNGGMGGDANTVYFTAGLDQETHGLFGSLTPVAPNTGGTDVLTYHNDTSRTGANLNETTLTPQNVNASSFGKLFHYAVDGYVYAQPLEVSQVSMGDGKVHNVLIVATENDSVYALDATDPTAGPRHNGVLWQDIFIDPANGITPIPFQDVETTDIVPVYGITGTPVIDRSTNTIYVVTRVKEEPLGGGGPHYVTKFHALNLINGQEKNGGPVTVGDTTLNANGSFTNNTQISVPGTGAGSNNGVIEFNALRENNRPGLVLDTKVPGHPNGVVFAGFGSQADLDNYHGWLVGFDAKTLKIVTVFNTNPNGGFGAIWQAGAAPSVASNGDLIFATGNGTFDAFTTTTPPGPAAQGEAGFGLGYAGIGNSVGVTFGAAIPSTGVSSTGLFFNGVYPTDKPVAPDVFQRLAGTGIDFTSGSEDPNGPHTFQATLSYSGTTLTETITDQTTGASFNRAYPNVDLPTSVGGGTAFVGFGGGTDGRHANHVITSWTYSSGGTTLINHAGGFASHGDLTATGITTFNGPEAVLTNLAIGNGGGQQSGNLFANARVNIQDFSTTFTFQMQPDPTSPLGDGLSFIIQNDTGHRPGPDHGLSILRVSPTPGTMTVVDSFTPFDFKNRDNLDLDTGSGSVTLLPDFPGTAHPHLAVSVDKSGRLYLIDQDNMGGFNPGGPDRVLQEFIANPNGLIYSSAAYFNGKVYIQGVGDVIKAFALVLDPATNTMLLNETPVSQGTTVSGFPGEVQSVSANGTSNGIVWSPQVDAFGSSGPATLFAYNANNLTTPLYTSDQAGPRDTAGGGIKFITPTIANGMVYLGTQFEVDVYGLLARSTVAALPAPVTSLPPVIEPITTGQVTSLPPVIEPITTGQGNGQGTHLVDQALAELRLVRAPVAGADPGGPAEGLATAHAGPRHRLRATGADAGPRRLRTTAQRRTTGQGNGQGTHLVDQALAELRPVRAAARARIRKGLLKA
ncbi:MAG: hypothetical protein JWN86_3368 [Planctomycetota bacterium]|nr:hypothetical protein [Planctomycetota bacterium]